MSWWGVGAVVGGAVIGAWGSNKAADAQSDAAQQSAALQWKMFQKQMDLQRPFQQAGTKANNRLLMLLGFHNKDHPNMSNSPQFGKYARDFSMKDFQADPGYAFRLKEGLQALDRQAAARGGLISGAALKSAARYGQEMGSQEYGNAFNRYQVNRSNQLNPLQSMTGAAQTSAGVLGNAAQGYADSAGDAYMGAGNARASGYVGGVNALNNAIGTGMNAWQNYQWMNKLFPEMSGAPGTGTPSGGGFWNIPEIGMVSRG